jgi:hypothetical protein
MLQPQPADQDLAEFPALRVHPECHRRPPPVRSALLTRGWRTPPHPRRVKQSAHEGPIVDHDFGDVATPRHQGGSDDRARPLIASAVAGLQGSLAAPSSATPLVCEGREAVGPHGVVDPRRPLGPGLADGVEAPWSAMRSPEQARAAHRCHGAADNRPGPARTSSGGSSTSSRTPWRGWCRSPATPAATRTPSTAALSLNTVPGVEGTINKIKMRKRQMFGRANFDLLLGD